MTNPGSQPPQHGVKLRRRRERRLWLSAFLVSAGVHVVVFLLWGHQAVPLSPFSAAGPSENDPRAAGGSMQALALSPPPPTPRIPLPVPLPTLDEVEPVEIEPEVFADPPSLADGEASGIGEPGTDDGRGQGDGGESGEGLNRLVPPTPRGMIIPPANDELEGSEIEVWVFVDEEGRVVPDSTRLAPPTSDRSFNERLIEEAAEWVFVPGRRGGQPIATWFPYMISM
jgi:hypothetical protein